MVKKIRRNKNKVNKSEEDKENQKMFKWLKTNPKENSTDVRKNDIFDFELS